MSVKLNVVSLQDHGSFLATRALGSRVAEDLRREASADDAPLVVDFKGVEVASSPVLDEVACALRAVIADKRGRFVVLTGMNEDVRDTLELVLERRDIALTVLSGEALEILGGRQHLEETLAEAQKLGAFTAKELAERLELKLPNLHQRLTQLEAAGAVSRTAGVAAGKQLVFTTPPVGDLTASGA